MKHCLFKKRDTSSRWLLLHATYISTLPVFGVPLYSLLTSCSDPLATFLTTPTSLVHVFLACNALSFYGYILIFAVSVLLWT